MTDTILWIVPILATVAAYVWFFRRAAQIKGAGGVESYSRMQLSRLFQLAEPERVAAAWSAMTAPEKSKRQKVTEVVSGAFAVVGGVGIEYVGRPLGVACTTANRVVLLDKEDGVVFAYGPSQRPRFIETGKKHRRLKHKRFGWEKAAIVRLENPGEDPIDIDIPADAVPVLVRWSHGEDVSRLAGPIPLPETF
jgi:hypothetical protein